MNVQESFNKFIKDAKRVLKVSRKPDKQEYLELAKVTSIGVVIVGVIFILTRSIGKYLGAGISAKMTKCDDSIVKYLGITLLPQAGVAIGMASRALDLGEVGVVVQSITLLAVLVYELVGPYLTKISLIKAGDIKPEEKTSARNKVKHIKNH